MSLNPPVDQHHDVEKSGSIHSDEKIDHHGKPLQGAYSTDLENRPADSYDDLPRGLMIKNDLRLIPVLAFMYGMSLIDRTDLPAARLSGADVALGLSVGQRYTIITVAFFLTYICFEIPSNYVFKKSGIHPKLWLPTATLCFGLIKLGSAWVPDWSTLAGIRALLGVFEAALFPGCVYLISNWYPRHVLAKRIAAFYLGGACLGGFGNIIAYGWSTIAPRYGLAGWQWIFLMMGILTVVAAICGYILVPHYPQHATHIDDAERKQILRRIEIDRHDVQEIPLTVREILTHLGNIRIWAYGLLFCLSTLPAYAFAYFLALIFRGFGYTVAESQLYSAPPYVVALVYGFGIGAISDKIKHRGSFVILSALISLAGTVGLGYGTSNSARFASAFFAQMGCQSNVSMVVSWSSNNVRTQNQRAVNSAVVVAGGGVGGIIAAVAFQQSSAPAYLPGLWTVIAGQLVICIVCLALMAFYRLRNRQADQGKRVLEGHATYRYTL